MGLMNRSRSATWKALAKTREWAVGVKTRRDLGDAYDELGKLAFGLVESGEIENEKLTLTAERIKAMKTILAS